MDNTLSKDSKEYNRVVDTLEKNIYASQRTCNYSREAGLRQILDSFKRKHKLENKENKENNDK